MHQTAGDTNVGISYGLLQNGAFVLNASVLFGLPIGETAGGDSQVLQSGNGEFNQLIRLNAGYSFSSAPVYTAASVGFITAPKAFQMNFTQVSKPA